MINCDKEPTAYSVLYTVFSCKFSTSISDRYTVYRFLQIYGQRGEQYYLLILMMTPSIAQYLRDSWVHFL